MIVSLFQACALNRPLDLSLVSIEKADYTAEVETSLQYMQFMHDLTHQTYYEINGKKVFKEKGRSLVDFMKAPLTPRQGVIFDDSIKYTLTKDDPAKFYQQFPETVKALSESVRPSLKVLFKTKENLIKYRTDYYDSLNKRTFNCNDPSEDIILGRNGIFWEGLGIKYHGANYQLEKENGEFHYYVYINVLWAGGGKSFDLRKNPRDICIQFSGGTMYGASYKSNIIKIPKEMTVNLLK